MEPVPHTQGSTRRWALGLAALGRPAYINTGSAGELPADRTVQAMRANTFDVLDAAMAAGVDWVDTARSYGRAEEFLADWLRERLPEPSPTVSSKWGYAYVGDWQADAAVHEQKEHSAARLRAQWKLSTDALGPALTLYQVHSLTLDSPLFTDPELLTDLAAIRDSGMRLGFSTSGAGQTDTIRAGLTLQHGGRPLFTAVQSTWNLWETAAGEALSEAAEGGALVLVKEPLANGRLVTQPPALVKELADRHHCQPDAIALAAAAAQPWATRVLLGSASVDQFHANLAADSVHLDDAELGALATLAQDPGAYWAARSALAWQ